MAHSDEIVEYGVELSGGGIQTRWGNPVMDRVYPLDAWISDRKHAGVKVLRRKVIVVEDWVEL